MADIIEKIKKIKGLGRAKGCTFEQIKQAQASLGLIFPDEYLEYVKEFGCIDFGSTEWTGLNIKGYLNTVTATEKEKAVNDKFPKGCFVLEDLNIDAQMVIVNEKGKVFLLNHDQITPLCDSMSEYLDKCIKKKGNQSS
jgi:hypothetical protein